MREKKMNRRKVYRTISIITVVVALLGMIGVNVLVSLLEDEFNWRIDCSKEKYYSISDQTKNVLNSLSEDVYIYTLYTTGSGDDTITQLLKNYDAASEHVFLENIDTSLDPAFTETYDPSGAGISAGSVIVSNADASLYKVLSVFDLYKIDTENMAVWAIQAEQRVTSAINYLNTGIAPAIKLLAGHQEYTAAELADLVVLMQGLGYEVDSYDSTTSSALLDPDFDTLMVVSPKQDLSDSEYQTIKQFLADGGDAIFLMDYVVLDSASGMNYMIADKLANFNALLMRYDVQVNRDYIIGGNPDMILGRASAHIPTMYGHEITQSLIDNGASPVLSDVSSITISGEDPASAVLMQTDDNTWAKALDGGGSMQIDQAAEDKTGPFVIATVGEAGDSRIVLFGTSSFVQPGTGITRAANEELIINAVNSIAETNTDINISAKLMVAGTIELASESQRNILIVLLVAVVPVAVLVFGLVIWLTRRRK